MEFYSLKYLLWAVALGGISAASLPLGSVVGLRADPKPTSISVLAAFGAGALIAALAVELVAPTVFALGSGSSATLHAESVSNFYSLIAGAVMGGVLFVVLDQLVNAKGGFLRKTASSIAYFSQAEKKRKEKMVERLGQFPLLQNLSTEHINSLVDMVRPEVFNDGEYLAKQGEEINRIVFILKGTVKGKRDGKEVVKMEEGEVAGLISLIANVPSVASGRAEGRVSGLILSKANFERLREISKEFDEACRKATEQRLDMLEQYLSKQSGEAIKWTKDAVEALQVGAEIPTSDELQRAREEHEGAPLAIWLGILLDGIPESLVIGGGLLVALKAQVASGAEITFGSVIPYTLIAGLFLSNFPEALSSSANMKLQGWSKRRIFFMWFSLMVITSIGAGLGFMLADSLEHSSLIFLEGLAAGAMLTMIAAAMIPEAVHIGNANIVGLSTLAGFLAAISFKLLE